MLAKYLLKVDNEQIVIIKEYTDEYREKVIKFLIEIAIKEFGFEEWRDYFNNAKFLEMNKLKENFWIAVDSLNNVIGTIGILNDEISNTAKLHSLYIKKEYRKKGIATVLYNCSLKFAQKCGYETIILHTYRIFNEAIKFYTKNGFRVTDDIKSKDGFWYIKNIKTYENHKWNDYFTNIRNKYSMRVSIKKPLIINLDGKGITNNSFFSLIDNAKDGFLDIMEETVKYFTKRYNCISIFGTDEVSFVLNDPLLLIEDLNSDINTKSDEIISMFSQYFFEYFNKINKNENVFWHGECFSIPFNKINSYIKYKSGSIKNVLTTYFLKRNNIKNAGKIKLAEKIEMCKKYDLYEKQLKKIENGILYLNGDRIDIDEFLKGNIKKIEPEEKRTEDEYFDITKWDAQ